MISFRRVFSLLLLVTAATFAHAQAYTSIVVIGDSLTDNGNDYHVSNAAYGASAALPAPATGYTLGRFTDGTTDTSPLATLYKGVWVEQLAALLSAKPTITDSLDGGTNYAYGFAFTGTGTSTLAYGPGNALSFPVNNMGLQLSTYLATKPVITNKTLFVIWGGANDLLNATTTAQVSTAVTNELSIIQSLITAGATDFLVVNLPPLGNTPRINTTGATAIAAANAAAASFNSGLATGLAALPAANPTATLKIFPLNVYTLFNNILANPSTYGFANVTTPAQGQAVNPDTYLFWDTLHPTTAGHHLIATNALALMTPGATTTTVTSSNLAANLGTAVTFTATVNAATLSVTGPPTGTVTFFDGSTALGIAQLSGTSPDTATFTTSSLAAGTHNITAAYTLSQYYTASTSPAIAEVVTAPSITLTSNVGQTTGVTNVEPPLYITDGSSGTAIISIASVGGFNSPVMLSCQDIPTHANCVFSPSTVLFSGANNTATSTLTLNTTTSAGLHIPKRPGSSVAAEAVLACSLLPLSLLAFRRRSLRGIRVLSVLILSGFAFAALSGCSSNTNMAGLPQSPKGTYSVIALATATAPGTTTTTTYSVTLTVVVQ